MKQKIYMFVFMFLIAVLLIVIGNELKLKKGNTDNISEYDKYTNKTYDSLKVSDDGYISNMYAFHMGTVISADVYGEKSKNIAIDISDLISNLDTSLLSVRDENSETYKLNCKLKELADAWHESGEENLITISGDLYDVLEKSIKVCQDSEGALDITIRPIALLWGIDGADNNEFKIPSKQEIDSTLQLCGYNHIVLKDNNQIVSNSQSLQIDLGAIGKGYALDKVREKLNDLYNDGVLSGASVSVGGSILIYGRKQDNSDWKVGIRNPFGSIDDMIGYLEFSEEVNICVSTSGNYEKYVVKDGKRYHHIFDIKTGYPAESGLASVTVVCSDGAFSDALSTACFTLGYDKSLDLLAKYNAEGIFVTMDGEVVVTEGLKDNYISLK